MHDEINVNMFITITFSDHHPQVYAARAAIRLYD
jgi:hypothetical protein